MLFLLLFASAASSACYSSSSSSGLPSRRVEFWQSALSAALPTAAASVASWKVSLTSSGIDAPPSSPTAADAALTTAAAAVTTPSTLQRRSSSGVSSSSSSLALATPRSYRKGRFSVQESVLDASGSCGGQSATPEPVSQAPTPNAVATTPYSPTVATWPQQLRRMHSTGSPTKHIAFAASPLPPQAEDAFAPQQPLSAAVVEQPPPFAGPFAAAAAAAWPVIADVLPEEEGNDDDEGAEIVSSDIVPAIAPAAADSTMATATSLAASGQDCSGFKVRGGGGVSSDSELEGGVSPRAGSDTSLRQRGPPASFACWMVRQEQGNADGAAGSGAGNGGGANGLPRHGSAPPVDLVRLLELRWQHNMLQPPPLQQLSAEPAEDVTSGPPPPSALPPPSAPRHARKRSGGDGWGLLRPAASVPVFMVNGGRTNSGHDWMSELMNCSPPSPDAAAAAHRLTDPGGLPSAHATRDTAKGGDAVTPQTLPTTTAGSCGGGGGLTRTRSVRRGRFLITQQPDPTTLNPDGL